MSDQPTPDDLARDGAADLKAAGTHFGSHDEGCNSQWDSGSITTDCDCGLDVARAALPAWVRRARAAEARVKELEDERDTDRAHWQDQP